MLGKDTGIECRDIGKSGVHGFVSHGGDGVDVVCGLRAGSKGVVCWLGGRGICRKSCAG